MVRLADGDRGAFHPLFNLLWPKISAFAHAQLERDAEDVAQQALFKLFERASDFDPEQDALAWALGIAAYEVRTARKWRLRRAESGDESLTALADAARDPEQQAIFTQLSGCAQQVFGALSAEDQQTLLLVAKGERPKGATFRKRLQRSLSRVQNLWRTTHGD